MRCFRTWVVTVLLVGTGLTPAVAQRQAPIRAVGIQKPRGSIFVRGQLEKDNRKSGDVTSRETFWMFQEGVETRINGYVYHPNLMDWQADLRFGLHQEQTEIDGQKLPADTTLLGFDLRGLFLKKKPLSMRIFAKHDESRRDRDFRESVDVEEDRYGLELLQSGPIRASLLGERISTDEEDELSREREDTLHARFSVEDRRDKNWFTKFTYDRYDTDETTVFSPTLAGVSTRQETLDVRDEVDISNAWKFGPGKRKHTLDGQVRLIERKGAFDSSDRTAQEKLNLVHSRTFSSFYRAEYESTKLPDEETETVSGEMGVEKKFYASLDLRARVIGRDHDFMGGFEKTYGGFFDAKYRKRTPIGRYGSSLTLGREQREQKSGTGQQFIRGESVDLKAFTFVALKGVNIQAESVVVSNMARTIVYVRDIDYTLRITGALTEIARFPGTAIPDGATVLVDYSSQIAREATFSTDHLNWSHRLDAKDLPVSVYGEIRMRDEDLESGEDPGNLDQTRTILVGSKLDYQGLTVVAEHEDRDQKLSPPSEATRGRARYRWTPRRGLNFSLGAHAERLDYKDAARFGLPKGRDFLETFGAEARANLKLGRRTVVRFESEFQDTRGRENRRMHRNRLSLHWVYGKLDLSARAQYDTLTQEDSDRDSVSFMFTIKRNF